MSILAWIVLGFLGGFTGSKLDNKTGEGIFLDIALGIVGAVVGGFVFNALGHPGVSGFNLYSLFVAVVGSVLFLVLTRSFDGRELDSEDSLLPKPESIWFFRSDIAR